ncbi:hypothetical protein Btru_074553 [Bulinus truncatus]|nr:hypothetical protein Btru_074553 [Bulinus truncatus]
MRARLSLELILVRASKMAGTVARCGLVCVLAVYLLVLSEGSSVERKPNPRSCGEADMCCQGQNNTCFVFGQRVDRSEDSARCYCDSNCLIMGDCCMDYHHHCKSEYISILHLARPPSPFQPANDCLFFILFCSVCPPLIVCFSFCSALSVRH